MEFEHISVLPEEVIAGLAIKPDGIYVDCTLGGAGHSSRIASQLNENGHLIGIDQDEDAIKVATERLKQYQCKIGHIPRWCIVPCPSAGRSDVCMRLSSTRWMSAVGT